ncbi:sensor histidine kinase [Kordiimonas aquimaris]|uniref:sensor histidine kinase n=1 Tax=Kordiimonas aquimaris TaxID=707591 RepID=UPI0021D0B4B0|nr:sensor histidine kinase [Kordiimonas aquimaris]
MSGKTGSIDDGSISQSTAVKKLSSTAKPKVRPRHYTRGLSPLMLRIMAVNAIALIILVGSVLYLNEFRQNLIDARTEELSIQATIIAGALGESAVEGPEAIAIDLAPSRQIITRLVGPTDNRARLFSTSGGMIADSLFLAGEKELVEEPLRRLDYQPSLKEQVVERLHVFLDTFTQQLDAPPNIDHPTVRADELVEVIYALDGTLTTQVRRRQDEQLVINVAVPVQRFRRVLGALLLTGQTDDIDAIVRAEQMLTVKVFAGVLGLTILLSFFLGRTLVRPIRVLARAAERVRGGIGREENIPEFAHRRDEIGDLSRSLSDMTGALYNQIDAVEQFAADVAHEIKNPLSSMRSALETIRMTKKVEVREKLLSILEDDVRRIDRLITDISDASRLDAELTRGQMDEIDLGVMLATLIDAYNTTGKPGQVLINFSDDELGVYLVKGIDARLGQVWRNLIDNGISFSPTDGTLNVALEVRKSTIRFIVEDAGPGLPEGAEDKVFSRFYSERPQEEQFGSHSGLGLAISKQVIEAHGGNIWAENRKDDAGNVVGARFIVDLPKATA